MLSDVLMAAAPAGLRKKTGNGCSIAMTSTTVTALAIK
jgi:hypothetical protein